MFIYPIYSHNWRNISTIYIYNKTSTNRNIITIKKIHREVGQAKDLSAPRQIPRWNRPTHLTPQATVQTQDLPHTKRSHHGFLFTITTHCHPLHHYSWSLVRYFVYRCFSPFVSFTFSTQCFPNDVFHRHSESVFVLRFMWRKQRKDIRQNRRWWNKSIPELSLGRVTLSNESMLNWRALLGEREGVPKIFSVYVSYHVSSFVRITHKARDCTPSQLKGLSLDSKVFTWEGTQGQWYNK
jgi:hypothetical protein